MLITDVTLNNISQWLVLAEEMEPIFQGPMLQSTEFHDYMQAKVIQKEALMALDRANNNALMGIIGFSRTNNRITWLGVFEKYRNLHVGSKLLECALNQMDRTKEITVTTFTDGYDPGSPARHLYHKVGFIDADNIISLGHARCLMKLAPEKTAIQGQSFHYQYRRYNEWTIQDNCPICVQEPGDSDVVLIQELEHSWLEASMQAQGSLWGKCHVLSKKHYIELYEMPELDLLDFMKDVQKVSMALKIVSGAVKINYEIHGNTVPHLHVHLFPRYIDDPFPSSPIDYRITEPNPYQSEQEFRNFLTAMKNELATF